MNVAVFHNLPSGGGKRALHGFVDHMIRTGHAVDVFVPSTADERFLSLTGLGSRVTTVPVRTTIGGATRSTLRYLPPIGPLDVSLADLEDAQRALAKLINTGRHDVVLVEQDRYTVAPFILKFLTKPSVYYCQQPCRLQESVLQRFWQGFRAGNGRLHRARALALRYAAARLVDIDRCNTSYARVILTNSYFSRETIFRAYGLNASVSYLGVDIKVFRPLDLPREQYVLSVGYLGPTKGYEFIIAALASIDERTRPTFVVAANAADSVWASHLQRLGERLGVVLDVRHSIPDTALVELYARAAVFVYAPYLEPFGLAPVEAMACGTPVVAVREAGVRETVLDGETGLLTERDERAFAQAVERLLSDDRERARMGRNGIDRVARCWTAGRAGERLLRHLQRAAGLPS